MEQLLSHLDAAYGLARWLTRNSHDAEDVVQEAYLRAFRFFDTFNGGDSRKWLLTIVRNTYYSWLKRNRAGESAFEFDEEIHNLNIEEINPETILISRVDGQLVWEALGELPAAFREIVILREIEGMSYKEIAAIASIPVGTVMSRLARARKRLQTLLTKVAERSIASRDPETMRSAGCLPRASRFTFDGCSG